MHGRFSIPLCGTGMQGDFTPQIHSKSDTFRTSKLLLVSEDVQLLWNGEHRRSGPPLCPTSFALDPMRGGTCGGQISCFFCSPGSSFHQRIQQIQGEANNVRFWTRKIDILESSKTSTILLSKSTLFRHLVALESPRICVYSRRKGKSSKCVSKSWFFGHISNFNFWYV